MAQEVETKWLNECDFSERYLPYKPRPDNEQSVNLYQEHLTIMERIMKIQKDISELKQKQAKYDHYDQLIRENAVLQRKIDEVRSETAQ